MLPARLVAVSGLGAKEPAAFVIETPRGRLLLDCGEGPEPGRLPDFAAIGKIDAVILSHSHKDHVGALRYLDRIGSPAVHATEPVLRFLSADVAGRPIPSRGRAKLLDIEIETGAAGHAPGGVWLRLAVGAGLLYMGDHSVESAVYAFDPPPATTTLIFDASYGDAETTQEPQRDALAQRAAAGPLLLPVPADGRGPEIAMFLQARGFDVAIDAAVRSAAAMLTDAARASAKADSIPALERLMRDARPLGEDAAAGGVMVAHGGSGDAGIAAALIRRWRDAQSPAIVFTGHLAAGTTGRKLIETGRARFQRWNVHPTLSQNLDLIARIKPRRVIPAIGDPRFHPLWRERLAPRDVITSKLIELGHPK